jgi:hypothetical protein
VREEGHDASRGLYPDGTERRYVDARVRT